MHFVKFAKTVDGLIQKYKDKLPTSPKVEHIMDNWDLFGISKEIIDVIGCVIVNGEKERDVYIELNAPKYLIRTYKHWNKFHKEKEPTPQKGYWAFHI